MKLLKTSISAFLLSLFFIGMATDVTAQDQRKAIQTYNEALKKVKAQEYEQAIDLYNQAIEEAKKLGEKGQDIVNRSQSKLPQVYQQLALTKYKSFQKDRSIASLDATIDAFKETKDIATKYNDSRTEKRVDGIITQLIYQKSILQYKQSNFNEALATLDMAIERNPNYSKAYYQKAIITKKMDSKNLEEAVAMFKKAIEVAERTNESQIVTKAKRSLHDELVYRGSKATENKNYDRALDLLNRALEYDASSAEAHFRLAEAFNKKQDWQKAVNHAQEALNYEKGGKTERAKIYFELGTAYKGLGQKENACNAFSNAAYGSFKSPAEHQMEYELKCESATN